MKLRWTLCLLFFCLSGCAGQNYLGITLTPPGEQATQALEALRSFQVESVDLPVFLGPIMVSNFSVALAERGLQPVVEGGDILVTLRYVQSDLTTDPPPGSLQEAGGNGGETRFIARIVVEFRRSGDPGVIWQGSIQRLHSVRPGDYMHTGQASVALLAAFRDLLSTYPELPREGEAS